MKTLIVEDDPHKLGELQRAVNAINPRCVISVATSLQEAMERLEADEYAAVLLDMAIPSHGGEAVSTDVYSQPVGGLDVLLFLATSNRSEQVIVLTQYPTVEYNRLHVPLKKVRDRLKEDDVHNLREVVLFSEDGLWRERLEAFLESVA